MAEGLISKSSLLNVYTAADAVVASGTLTITGLMKIKTASITSMIKQIAVAEMSQIATIGTVSTPVVTAATKYQVKIGNTGNRREGAQSQLLSFGYTSPYVLSGSAATDRNNLFLALATKINRTQSVFGKAFALSLMPYTGEAVSNLILGEKVTGNTSGATGIVIYDLDNGSTGTVTLGNVVGTFINGETVTAATSLTTFVAAFGAGTWAAQTGNGLVFIDTAGYYASLPYTGTTNYVIGEIITGAGGATGRVIANIDAGGTGTLKVAGVVGRYVNGEALVGSTSGAGNTATLGTAGWESFTGLSYFDTQNGTLGYYGPYTGSFRRGPNTVILTAGFSVNDLVITATGVVGVGQGSRMITDVPVRELTSGNLAKGYWSFPTNNPPIAGDHYTTYTITSTVTAFQDALSDNGVRHENTQVLYLDENIPSTGAGVNAGYVAVTGVLDAFLV